MGTYTIRNNQWVLADRIFCDAMQCNDAECYAAVEPGTCLVTKSKQAALPVGFSATWEFELPLSTMGNPKTLDSYTIASKSRVWYGATTTSALRIYVDGELKKVFTNIPAGEGKFEVNELALNIDVQGASTVKIVLVQTGLLITPIVSAADKHDAIHRIQFSTPPVQNGIYGTVKDGRSRQPLAGVLVSANGHSALSNASGEYNLELSPGSYAIDASRLLYYSFSSSITVGDQPLRMDIPLTSVLPDMPTWGWALAGLGIATIAVIAVKKRRK